PLNFNCSGLPTESSCVFSPATVAAGSGTTDVVLTITTTAPTAAAPSAALARPRAYYAAWLPFSGLGLMGVMVIVAPKRHRKAVALLMTMSLMSALMLLVGCGGSSHHDPGTTKGTFPVTVTGTSGNVTHSATFNLTVN